MRTIPIFLFLFAQIVMGQLPDVKNFKVTSDPNKTYSWYDRFYVEFDIKGNYRYNEIKLWLYTGRKTSKPSSTADRVWYIRWNREGDYYLNYPNYFKKSTWSSWLRGGRTAPPYNIK
ncbi:MAG: hypothetical protein AAGF77_01860 [Bacteroidota bacterium]